MSVELDSLREEWRERIEELESEGEAIEERQDPMVKADMPAIRERAAPELKKKTVERCLDDLEDCNELEEVLAVLGQWRAEAEDRDKRILNRNEWFRNHYTRFALEKCIDELETVLPESEFEECPHCGALKKPMEDARYSKDYRWACFECVVG
ncbi:MULTISPECIES: hypothetical protein [Haloferacaceae]|jgi:hypothetical protein|uniref:hypothetical protein n=1 Tax=Haloferacaceae TaxID=1644056 RepID=UPI000F4C8DDB|nr:MULTISPECIES: hypothetical protein [Haloferacales]